MQLRHFRKRIIHMRKMYNMRKVISEIEHTNFDKLDKQGIDTKAMRIQAALMLYDMIKVGKQSLDDDTMPVKFKQEQQRIAVYAGQTLHAVLTGIDEAAVDEQLLKLKVMMDEIEATKKVRGTTDTVVSAQPAGDTNGPS
jgi:hypothetical protein